MSGSCRAWHDECRHGFGVGISICSLACFPPTSVGLAALVVTDAVDATLLELQLEICVRNNPSPVLPNFLV